MLRRRTEQNGLPMFITTNVRDRRPIFSNPSYAREAVELLYRLQTIRPFLLFAFVIMPNHCHFLVNVSTPHTVSQIMNSYKTGLTFDLGIGAFWQPRFDLRVPDNCAAVVRYIHNNPVKAGLVATPEEYPWSSGCGKWDVTQLS